MSGRLADGTGSASLRITEVIDMKRLLMFSFLALMLMTASCATFPTGPSVMSLPGTSKNFDQFRMDDALCRQFASEQVGGVTGQQAGEQSAVKSAAVGTVLGAAAGALIGSTTGDMGTGAAIGAGSGLLLGSAAGSGYSWSSYYETQRRYDNAYLQCMYAKGNRIPVYGDFTEPSTSAPPRGMYPNPHPPDYPPPAGLPRY